MEEQPNVQIRSFEDILAQVPVEPPVNGFDAIVAQVPEGAPATFSQAEPPEEKGFFRGVYDQLTGQTEEEMHAQAANVIALSEISGEPLNVAAQQVGALDDVYDVPVKQAIQLRADRIAEKFTVAKDRHRAGAAYTQAVIDGDPAAMMEATRAYEAASIKGQESDAKVPLNNKDNIDWWERSVGDLTGQLFANMTSDTTKDYALGAAAIGGAVTGGLGIPGGAMVGAGRGMFKDMFQAQAGAQTIGKIKDGMDPVLAYNTSLPSAALIALSERLKVNALFKNIPGLNAIFAEAGQDAAGRVVKMTLGRAALGTAQAGVHGTAQEMAQEVIEATELELSKQLSNKLHGTDLKPLTVRKILENVAATGKEVLPGMLTLGGLGDFSAFTAETINRKADERAAAKRDRIENVAAAPQEEIILRDENGAEVDIAETVPAAGDVRVFNEDGDRQAAVPITPEEEVVQATRHKEPVLRSETFDDLVLETDENTDQAIKDVITSVQEGGARWGDFVETLRSTLGRKEAKVVEDLIDARAKATNRTKEQFAEDHRLKMAAERDETGKLNAAVEFIKDGETIVKAFQGANLRDVTHEVSHVFRKDLNEAELKDAEKHFGVKNGKWTVENEEAFAEGFIQFLETGEATTKSLAGVFQKFKSWMARAYHAVNGRGVKVSPEMEQLYTMLFADQMSQEYIHNIAAAKEQTRTLFSKAEQEQGKRKVDVQAEQQARMEKLIGDEAALRTAIKEQVVNARQAAREGNRLGYEKAQIKAKAIAQRASNRRSIQKARGNWRKKIEKLVKTAKSKKRSGKKVGKFTADFQQVANTFIDVFSMPIAEAKALDKEMPFEDLPENFGTDYDVLRKHLIMVRANSGRLDVTALEQLHDDLKDVLTLEKNVRQQKIAGRVDRARGVGQKIMGALKVLAERKGLDPNVRSAYEQKTSAFWKLADQGMYNGVLDFHGLMELLDMGGTSAMGEGAAVKFTETLDMENQEKTGIRENNERMIGRFQEIYGLAGKKESERAMWLEETADPILNEKYEITDKKGMGTGKFRSVVATKPQLRKLWMELQDPSLREMYEADGMTQEIMTAIRGKLTEQDVNYALAQFEMYNEYYERVNEVYREVYGEDLPQSKFYSPILRDINAASEKGIIDDLLMEQKASGYRAAGSRHLKVRVNSKVVTTRMSDIDAMNNYIRQMEHFIAFAETIQEWNTLFSHRELRESIRDVYGPGYLETVDKLLTNIAKNGSTDAGNGVGERIARDIRGNLAKGVVGLKPLAVVKQMTSFLAFSESVPMKEFTKLSLEFLANPKRAAAELKEISQFIQNRGENIDRDISMITNTSEYNAILTKKIPPNYTNITMMFVKAGDIGAIYMGGWAQYKYNRSQGMGKKEAVRKMELTARNTQQSNERASLSAWQQGTQFMQLFTMFTSSQRQYLQRAVLTGLARKNERMTNAQATKMWAIYLVGLPVLFQIAAQGGMDDEEDTRQVLKAVLASPLSTIPLAGQSAEYVLNKAILGHTYGRGMGQLTIFSPAQAAVKGVEGFSDMFDSGDINIEDVLEATRNIAAMTEYIGIPGRAAGNLLLAGQDLMDGKPGEAGLEAAGMSSYAAEKRVEKIEARGTNK